jgi:hypothetical protein
VLRFFFNLVVGWNLKHRCLRLIAPEISKGDRDFFSASRVCFDFKHIHRQLIGDPNLDNADWSSSPIDFAFFSQKRLPETMCYNSVGILESKVVKNSIRLEPRRRGNSVEQSRIALVIRQLERTLGRKSLEIEILKNVVGE